MLNVQQRTLTVPTVIPEEQDRGGVSTVLRPTTSRTTLLVPAVYVKWASLTVLNVVRTAVSPIISAVTNVCLENIL